MVPGIPAHRVEDEEQYASDADTERAAADDVERVVRTQIHAGDPVHHGQADDDDAAGAAEIEEQEHRDRARDDRVSRHERLAADRDVAAEVSASRVAVTDARSRPLPVDELLDDLFSKKSFSGITRTRHRVSHHLRYSAATIATTSGTKRMPAAGTRT